MSTPKKLRSGTESEVTKLKVMWRDSLSEDAREFWRSLFVSPDSSQAQIRQQIFAKLKINLRHDSQLTKFRDWEMEQRALDLEAERQEEDERRALAENPDWTLDQARDVVLKKAYQRATATGDFVLGLKTVRQDLNAKVINLDREKFEFDAVAACRKHLPALKAIEANKSLSESQKTEAFMEKLFGRKPA